MATKSVSKGPHPPVEEKKVPPEKPSDPKGSVEAASGQHPPQEE